LIDEQFNLITNSYIPVDSVESQWKSEDLESFLKNDYSIETDINNKIFTNKKLIPESIASEIVKLAHEQYKKKYHELGENRLLLEKQVMLQLLDVHWKEHLAEIDHLRNSVGLRAYAQKNPKNEFKKEAYTMFESMLSEIDSETIRVLFSLKVTSDDDMKSVSQNKEMDEIVLKKEEFGQDIKPSQDNEIKSKNEARKTLVRDEPKIGRNDLVDITNGKETKNLKYKKAQALIESGEWRVI
jgi:preprotein translocase subunit SecA